MGHMAFQSCLQSFEKYRITDLDEAAIEVVGGVIVDEMLLMASVAEYVARLVLKEIIELALIPPLGIIWTVDDWKTLLSR